MRMTRYGSLTRHGSALAIILITGTLTFRTALDIFPISWENLLAMSVVDRSPWNLMTESSGREPTYRPVPYLSIWLQGRFADVNARPYFAFNQLAWIACAFALYALVYALSRSTLAAFVSGLALLLDSRANVLLTWIDDRQMSIAVLCGLLVLNILAAAHWHHRRALFGSITFALLLCAGLSKEYGFAFSGAAIVFALASTGDKGVTSRERKRNALWLSLVVVAVAGTYLVLRVSLASQSFGHDYCQDQSFFRIRINHQVCYSAMDSSTKAAQFLYNSGATLIGTPMPWLFTPTGAPQWPSVDWYVLGFGIAVLVLALIGLIKAPRQCLPLISLVVFQALLSFMVYRPRNQLVGAAGLYAMAGIGLAIVLNHMRARSAPRVFPVALIGTLLLVLLFHARDVARTLDEERKNALRHEPCRWVGDPLLNANVIHRVKQRYSLNNPRCT